MVDSLGGTDLKPPPTHASEEKQIAGLHCFRPRGRSAGIVGRFGAQLTPGVARDDARIAAISGLAELEIISK